MNREPHSRAYPESATPMMPVDMTYDYWKSLYETADRAADDQYGAQLVSEKITALIPVFGIAAAAISSLVAARTGVSGLLVVAGMFMIAVLVLALPYQYFKTRALRAAPLVTYIRSLAPEYFLQYCDEGREFLSVVPLLRKPLFADSPDARAKELKKLTKAGQALIKHPQQRARLERQFVALQARHDAASIVTVDRDYTFEQWSNVHEAATQLCERRQDTFARAARWFNAAWPACVLVLFAVVLGAPFVREDPTWARIALVVSVVCVLVALVFAVRSAMTQTLATEAHNLVQYVRAENDEYFHQYLSEGSFVDEKLFDVVPATLFAKTLIAHPRKRVRLEFELVRLERSVGLPTPTRTMP